MNRLEIITHVYGYQEFTIVEMEKLLEVIKLAQSVPKPVTSGMVRAFMDTAGRALQTYNPDRVRAGLEAALREKN